jgi:hypothetical protein
VAVLERRATAFMQRRPGVMPEELHEALAAYKVHVYRGLADRARHEARWARDIALVDALEAASPAKLRDARACQGAGFAGSQGGQAASHQASCQRPESDDAAGPQPQRVA